jgi:NitT/TauT family transport system permease protein
MTGDVRASVSIANRDATASRLLRGRWPWPVLAMLVLLAVWWPLSIRLRPWVPTPAATFDSMWELVRSADFYSDLGVTLRRILMAFVLAGLAGALLGIWMGLSHRAERFFAPVVAIALAVPDPVYIIFAVLTFGVSERSTDAALVIAVAPFVTNIVRSSVAARDMHLDDLARVYRFGQRRRYLEVLIPQLVPALLAAARTAFALSWKIVVVVEGMSQPDGIGSAILDSFNLLRTREVFAYAILFTVIMQMIEYVGLRPIQRRALAWRS